MTGATPGIVDVSIDGELKTTLDLYSSPAQYQAALYTSDALSTGAPSYGSGPEQEQPLL